MDPMHCSASECSAHNGEDAQGHLRKIHGAGWPTKWTEGEPRVEGILAGELQRVLPCTDRTPVSVPCLLPWM